MRLKQQLLAEIAEYLRLFYQGDEPAFAARIKKTSAPLLRKNRCAEESAAPESGTAETGETQAGQGEPLRLRVIDGAWAADSLTDVSEEGM